MLPPFSLDFPVPVPAPRAGGCAPEEHGTRPGTGRLQVMQVRGGSALTACAACSPLQLLAPRPAGQAVWAICASHGGGLVAGDAVELSIEIGPGATACLGTQAETKVYRRGGEAGATQRLGARVGAGGLLALLPDPVSPFAGSWYQQVQRFELAPGASLVVLDAVTAGRAARGERWAFERYASRNEVRTAGRLLLADAVRLAAGEGPPLQRRLAGLELLATAILVGPRVASGAAEILRAVGGAPAAGDGPVLAAASPLTGGALLRIAARSVEAGTAALRTHLAFLATPLDGDPLLRRP